MEILEKQYEIITKDRGNIEGRVIGTLLSDLSLYMDYKLKESDFIIDKCKFFFSLGKVISKTYAEVDEIGIEKIISENRELRGKYKEFGGWESIQNAIKLGNKKNMDAYIDDLYKNNFLIKRGKKELFTVPIETDGQTINPYKELFPSMTCKEIEEYYIGDLAKDAVAVINNNIKSQSLIIGKEKRKKLKEGISIGIPYDVSFEFSEKEIGMSDDETLKRIYASPLLSSKTNGLGNGGGVTFISGYSGLGKSTYAFLNMILPMVFRGERCAIYSNEQKVEYFQAMLYSFISSNVFKYYKLTRDKIQNGQFDEYEEELMDKIDDFLKRRNFDEMVYFYTLEEFDIEEIIRISKGLISHEGVSCFLIDTFKSEDSSDAQYVGKMLEATKKLDVFGNKFDVKVLCTIQLTPSNEGSKSYLTASDLAECKKVKTVSDLLLMMRKVVPELELDPKNKKYYLQPYKVKKKTGGRSKVKRNDSEWEKEIITFTERELEYEYRLLFLNKSRRGEDDLVFLMRFNGRTGRFEEIGLCGRVYRGNIG